jgi:hypothetical protein
MAPPMRLQINAEPLYEVYSGVSCYFQTYGTAYCAHFNTQWRCVIWFFLWLVAIAYRSNPGDQTDDLHEFSPTPTRDRRSALGPFRSALRVGRNITHKSEFQI